eukprot:502509-Prymnesium_polylepis.2
MGLRRARLPSETCCPPPKGARRTRQRQKPSLGRMIGLRVSTCVRACAALKPSLRIRYAMQIDAERETPREQWTKTALPSARAASMASYEAAKCSLMSASSTSRTLHHVCFPFHSATLALRLGVSSASAVTACATLRCSRSRVSAAASARSPRYSSPGTTHDG